MKNLPQDIEEPEEDKTEDIAPLSNGNKPYTPASDIVRHHLKGMYQSWFLEYASYVILERAVPHIDDGLKPVQRRILHSMETLDDGRFNKVANIVGNTMQYHPHGDASIGDALVQLGQKELLVETQGNWGNTLTGASAAAPRYIEARLSPFALEVLFNPKITEWTMSYDGRKREPVTLPAKFPLLLAQGAEGIAVGLSSKILPHNFNELIDAAVAYLRGEDFELFPDFPTGGFIDVTRYNDGKRGGAVRIRSKITKIDNRTLAVTEIPYGKTTGTVIASIIKAFEKGKIKIRKVDDNTAEHANILVHLQPGTSSDKAIDALYAFTDCEESVSPNCCVISERKPHFLGVSDVLRHSVDTTRTLLGRELEIQLGELQEKLFFASLEKLFIENRIYKDRQYENAAHIDAAVEHIASRLEPLTVGFIRPVTREDILRLVEIKMKRIFRFNSDEADQTIARLRERIAELTFHLEHLTDYTINWYTSLKEKYGAAYPRRTVIRNFDTIQAATVAEANEKLYFNREEGFIGTALKKDDNVEFICNCSAMDDIIIFYRDGRYKVVKVQEKLFVDKNVLHVGIFNREDRTRYNVIYRDGKTGTVTPDGKQRGFYYMKRFAVTGVTRDRVYDLTQGTPGSKVMWFTANPNGEAEVVKVILKPKARLKSLQLDIDFADLAIRSRQSMGNLVTKNEVLRMSLKERGVSTLGGRQVWFDRDVMRINYDGRGKSLGEFMGTDRILVILKDGTYYTSTFEATNHYEDSILTIEKYNPERIWTAVLYDADQKYYYIKRFTLDDSPRKQSLIGENPDSRLLLLSCHAAPRFSVTFGGHDAVREPLEVEAANFIGVKSPKAKGKRLTTFEVKEITELEPVTPDPVEPEITETDAETEQEDARQVVSPDISDEELRDEITGQKRLF